jgi:hypothetical protein
MIKSAVIFTLFCTTISFFASAGRPAQSEARHNVLKKPTVPVEEAMTDRVKVREAQKILKAKGFFKGKITGLIDKATSSALMEFQKEAGLERTGELTNASYLELKGRYSPLVDDTNGVYD